MLRLTDEQFAELRQRRAPQTYAQAVAAGAAHQRGVMEGQERAKYRNKKTRVGVRVFASRLEARRYLDLRALETAGEISALKCQVPYTIEIGGEVICKYIADFTYCDSTGKTVVEDVKGMPTPVYKIKKKLMSVVLGIDVVEVRRKAGHARRA